MHKTSTNRLSPAFLSVLILLSGIFLHGYCLAAAENLPGSETGNVLALSPGLSNGLGENITFQLGGVFQTDYRYYNESERADNGFDIRRAQIELTCHFKDWLKLNMEYELKNDVTDRLMDTYAEISLFEQALRVGHFKKLSKERRS